MPNLPREPSRGSSRGPGGIQLAFCGHGASLSGWVTSMPRYGAMPAVSIPSRQGQAIHNYPELLGEAGYETIGEERLTRTNLLESPVARGDTHVFLVAQAT